MRRTMKSRWGSKFWGRSALAAVVASSGFATFGSPLSAQEVEEREYVVVVNEDDEDGEEKSAPKRWLGIMLKNIEGDLSRYLGSEKGILVDSVYPDSPAAKADLQAGDILLSAGDVSLSEPGALLKVMRNLDDDDQLQITLLRKGKELKVEVAPAARPEDLEIEMPEDIHLDLQVLGEEGEGAVKDAIRRLRIGNLDKDLNIMRLGGPSMVWRGNADAEVEGNMNVVIVKEIDGEKLKVTVNRTDDEPTTVTVVTDDETKEYKLEDLDDLPEEVAEIVKPILGGKNRFSFHVVPSMKGMELSLDHEKMAEKARELAEKARATALERAARSRDNVEKIRKRVREVAEESGELAELRSLVDELRKEVKELRSKLNDRDE